MMSLYVVRWKVKGVTGIGHPVRWDLAWSWRNQMNKHHGEGTHWIERHVCKGDPGVVQ
jgi:hypothetical protein